MICWILKRICMLDLYIETLARINKHFLVILVFVSLIKNYKKIKTESIGITMVLYHQAPLLIICQIFPSGRSCSFFFFLNPFPSRYRKKFLILSTEIQQITWNWWSWLASYQLLQTSEASLRSDGWRKVRMWEMTCNKRGKMYMITTAVPLLHLSHLTILCLFRK